MRSMAKILVVEDEVRLADALVGGLSDCGYQVVVAHDGHDGYRLAKEQRPDAILLDLMLPGLSGREVCERLRQQSVWTPILVLTAKDGVSDETDALDMGADDYLRKPFAFPVLVARCRVLLRRGPRQGSTELTVGGVTLDPTRRVVRHGNTPVDLTPREFALLEHLMRNVGRVQSKEHLLAEVWGGTTRRDPNLVEVYIGYLRRKLDEPFGTTLLRTSRGRGYVIESQA
jgi:DNA-binding response OmpR family regulator